MEGVSFRRDLCDINSVHDVANQHKLRGYRERVPKKNCDYVEARNPLALPDPFPLSTVNDSGEVGVSGR